MSATDDRGNYLLTNIDTDEEIEVTLVGENLELLWPCGDTYEFDLEALWDFCQQVRRVSAVNYQAGIWMDVFDLDTYFVTADSGSIIVMEGRRDITVRFLWEQLRGVLMKARRDAKKAAA